MKLSGRQDGQHLRRRHRRRLRVAGRDRGRHLEPAAGRGEEGRPAPPRCSTARKIPGEILDLMVVNTDDAEGQSQPRQGAGRHLVRDDGADGRARRRRARRRARRWPSSSGTDLAGFEAQLETTYLFYDARADAVAFTDEPATWSTTMDQVRQFSFEHGLFGAGREVGRRDRHRLPGRQDARRRRQREAALRPSLHGRWRPTASSERQSVPVGRPPCAACHRIVSAGAGGGCACSCGLLPAPAASRCSICWPARQRATPANPGRQAAAAARARWRDAVARLAFEPDPRTGEIPLVADTRPASSASASALAIATADRPGRSASRSASCRCVRADLRRRWSRSSR